MDLSAPVKPSGDDSPGQHPDYDLMRDSELEERNHAVSEFLIHGNRATINVPCRYKLRGCGVIRAQLRGQLHVPVLRGLSVALAPGKVPTLIFQPLIEWAREQT